MQHNGPLISTTFDTSPSREFISYWYLPQHPIDTATPLNIRPPFVPRSPGPFGEKDAQLFSPNPNPDPLDPHQPHPKYGPQRNLSYQPIPTDCSPTQAHPIILGTTTCTHLKLNMDIASLFHERIGIGFIPRNHTCKFIVAGSTSSGALSLEEGEARGILQALLWARSLDARDVILVD